MLEKGNGYCQLVRKLGSQVDNTRLFYNDLVKGFPLPFLGLSEKDTKTFALNGRECVSCHNDDSLPTSTRNTSKRPTVPTRRSSRSMTGSTFRRAAIMRSTAS